MRLAYTATLLAGAQALGPEVRRCDTVAQWLALWRCCVMHVQPAERPSSAGRGGTPHAATPHGAQVLDMSSMSHKVQSQYVSLQTCLLALYAPCRFSPP